MKTGFLCHQRHHLRWTKDGVGQEDTVAASSAEKKLPLCTKCTEVEQRASHMGLLDMIAIKQIHPELKQAMRTLS